MSDSRGAVPPGRDIRALFDKANLGNSRYVTFAGQKTPAKSDALPSIAAEAEPASAVTNASHTRSALNSIFEGHARLRIESSRSRLTAGSGATIIFASCAGGVGKTTLCATAGRVLSTRLSNVLIADRCTEGIIPYFFSLERLRAGGLQTVYPNARRAGYQITLVVAPCSEQANTPTVAWLERLQAESTLTLLDIPTLNGYSAPAQAVRSGQLVVPLVPDVQSIASIARVEELSSMLAEGQHGRCLFVLNRFDEVRPLHREIRAHLENLLGDRLAPVAIRESEYVPEALSLGMTVLDHRPQSPVANDFEQLVLWLEERLSSTAETAADQVEIA